MKEYLTAKEISYNAIFFSVFKALIVFEFLLEAPRTLDEIQEHLASLPYIKSTPSKDSLRVYINTFREHGCEVIKKLTQKKHRQYHYFIPENPFHPAINQKQANRYFEIYDILLYNLPFSEVISLEILTRKLNKNFKNEFFTELYESHSLLQDFDIGLLKELEKCCINQDIVTVQYNSPRSGIKPIKIQAKKIIIQNYKVYLSGFGFEYNQDNIFLIERIVEIVNVEPCENITTDKNNINIIYELYDPTVELHENEVLIDQDNFKRIITHKTNNLVLSNHRFLQLADTCKIIAPQHYKEDFIMLLRNALEGYQNEK